jgi:hypothetical protein
MRTVQVYIEGQRLDLFDDEQISVQSTQQNVQDISKVFTDFSQSFSVPASTTNNAIFNHFYQNDVSQTIDQNIRRSAFIEIDLTTFREGQISLEKSEVKDNQAYSYQVTFYGNLTSLKDKFGKDKLQGLTFLNSLAHTYSGAEVLTRITDAATDHKVRYPLIVGRNLTYGDGGSTDIKPSTGSGEIAFNELFPAIKLISILAAITSKYGVAFQGTFLGTKRFTNAFLYCKNANEFLFNTPPTLADITALTTSSQNNNTSLSASDFFSIANDTLTISQYNLDATFPDRPLPSFGSFLTANHKIDFNVQNVSDASAIYYIDVYQDGQLMQTLEGSGGGFQTGLNIPNNQVSTPRTFQFFLRSTVGVTLDFFVEYTQRGAYTYNVLSIPVSAILTNVFQAQAAYNISAEISVVNYLPDMTVESFFSGMLKMFNLTCYPLASDIYQIEPLDDWYSKGALVDITEYTDIKSIKIDRIKLYKNVLFSYQESESATNKIFRDLTNRGYGNTDELFDYDGGEFKVELPFENMMMQKFTNTNLQIGETIDASGNAYTSKPMILYMYDQLSADYKFNNGGSTSQTVYMPFGQDVLDTNINYTLNFNADISTLLDAVVPNTLFSIYYSPYLSNLYNLKNRETSVKTILPISLLTSLELNDRLIIRDKRYMINDMKSNLTTGEVDFTLLNDFTDIISDGVNVPVDPIQPSDGAQCIDVRILLPNGAISASVTTTATGVTITPSSVTTDGTVSVCIPANTDLLKMIVTEDATKNINSENFFQLRTEQGEDAIYILTVTYTFANGNTTANQIFIQQQP